MTADQIKSIDNKTIWHPFSPVKGGDEIIPIKKAKGAYIYDYNDNQIIDAISSWWVNIHGHANEEIAEAIYNQAKSLEHVIFAGFSHEPAAMISENILSIVPDTMRRTFFSDDGSTSVEVAIKFALKYWELIGEQRATVVALDGAYHGDTFGAMSVGARGTFHTTFEPYLFGVEFIPFPEDESVVDHFRKICEEQPPACFIYEPLLQGAGGMRIYDAAILNQLLEVAKEFKVVCIADEVLTGFGRTGKNFASDHCEVKPDIMCMSKGITGGTLPLGLTVVNERIEQAFIQSGGNPSFYHGHSYTANPISCAASVKSFEILQREKTQNDIQRICVKQSEARDRFDSHEKIRSAKALGTILALEVETGGKSSYFNEIRDKLYLKFLAKNILLRPLGNIIYVLPPYVISSEDLDIIYDAISEVLEEI